MYTTVATTTLIYVNYDGMIPSYAKTIFVRELCGIQLVYFDSFAISRVCFGVSGVHLNVHSWWYSCFADKTFGSCEC